MARNGAERSPQEQPGIERAREPGQKSWLPKGRRAWGPFQTWVYRRDGPGAPLHRPGTGITEPCAVDPHAGVGDGGPSEGVRDASPLPYLRQRLAPLR